jgi:hypothetical protein
MAEALSGYLPLRILEPPIAMPKLPLVLIWHQRSEKDPGCTLFRRAVVDAVRVPPRPAMSSGAQSRRARGPTTRA